MSRIFISIISISLLIYIPYVFGKTAYSSLHQNNAKTMNNDFPLIEEALWRSYLSRNRVVQLKNIPDPANISIQDTRISQKNTSIKTISKKVRSKIQPSEKNTIEAVPTKTALSEKKQQNLKKIEIQKNSLSTQIDNKEQPIKKMPSIIEPIPSIKPSLY